MRITFQCRFLALLSLIIQPIAAQVNSGSDGHDGEFHPSTHTIINMADHPDGIYHYTSVTIPTGVSVSFLPNASNTPVVWLVKNNCDIAGTVSVQGQDNGGINGLQGGAGGPGGYRGGNGLIGPGVTLPQAGFGPGGGKVTSDTGYAGGNGSYGTEGQNSVWNLAGQYPSGDVYGNSFLLPLDGGSGGSGSSYNGAGGSGGGGAILVVVSGQLTLSGGIDATGGGSLGAHGGGGSGGAIRLVATTLAGNGSLDTHGGLASNGGAFGSPTYNQAGSGRVRIDAFSDAFTGGITGVVTRGAQPIIFLPENQSARLAIQSVAGVSVATSPSGKLQTPDVIIPATQQNPIPIVVRCTNIPLNTEIIIDVKPAHGATARGVALNTAGTQSLSTATILVNMPRGGGNILAKAVSGITIAAAGAGTKKPRSIAQAGWTMAGERFAKVEVTAAMDGSSSLAYLTESGKRYSVRSR
ncbi:MAG TPA: hypothetical protein VG796_07165 [Verrucomicrobiales bacterium]|nr:hypothetical protein [Verrucomicrobiales bacterium]